VMIPKHLNTEEPASFDAGKEVAIEPGSYSTSLRKSKLCKQNENKKETLVPG
jgi:hypothetical protein